MFKVSMRKMSGPKTESNIRSEQVLHNLIILPSIINVINSRKIRKAEHVTRGRQQKFMQYFVGKPLKRQVLVRPRHKCQDKNNNNKTDLKETKPEVVV
jgi:hypothetical protein